MTREHFNKAEEIVRVLDRIDSVLESKIVISNNKSVQRHYFKEDVSNNDIAVLAKLVIKDSFLKLLYEKKLELEKELKQL